MAEIEGEFPSEWHERHLEALKDYFEAEAEAEKLAEELAEIEKSQAVGADGAMEKTAKMREMRAEIAGLVGRDGDEIIRRRREAQPAPAPATPQPAAHPPATPQPVQIKRGNLLQILIDEAVKADGIDHMRVFSRLREWASEKPPRQPLLGVTEEGIQWVDSNDKGKTLSLDALSKRLKRRR